jgi:hypothetical protein
VHRLRVLASERDFRLYVAARLTSTAGSMFTWVALPVLVYQLTRSAAWTAAVAATQAVPYLALGLVAGVVADRKQRRWVMALANVGSAIALASVFVADRVGAVHPAHVLVAAVAMQSCYVFFDAANFGALPDLVGADDVLEANSLLYSASSLVETLLPALAGALLVATGPSTLLLVDAATCTVAAVLVLALRSRKLRAQVEQDLHLRDVVSGARQALRYIARTPPIRVTTVASACICVVTGAFSGQLVVWADQRLDIGEGELALSLVFGAWTVGGLGGAMSSPWLERRLGAVRLVRWLLVAGLACGALALVATTVWLALPALVVWSAASTAALITGVSLRQSLTPESMVSTVNTAGRMLALGLGWTLGALGAGAIASAAQSAVTAMGVALVALVPALWAVRPAAVGEPVGRRVEAPA